MVQTSEVASLQSNLHEVTAGTNNPLAARRRSTFHHDFVRFTHGARRKQGHRVGKATALPLGPFFVLN
jgi:hypothetical protein